MPDDVVEQLRLTHLFSRLAPDDLKAIAKLVERIQYPARSVVHRQAEPGLTAYWVERGELRVLHVDSQGMEREVARLQPGSFVGETSLLLGEPRDATVEAAEDASILCLGKEAFEGLLEERPWILKQLQMRPDVVDKRRAKRFRWQYPDEGVVVNLRKHRIIVIGRLVFPAAVLLGILGGFVPLYVRLAGSKWVLLTGGFLVVIPCLYMLFLVVDHLNDNYVVTNMRVVHVESIPLFRETRTEAPLRAVQDIQQVQEGLGAQLYQFGDLIIETAGERGNVVFRSIANPAQVREVIFEQIQRASAGARAEQRSAVREALERQFGARDTGERAPEPDEISLATRGRILKVAAWLLAPVRAFGYFLPSLRNEQGDTITWRKHWVVLVGPIWLPTTLFLVVTLTTMWILARSFGDLVWILGTYAVILVFLLSWWIWQFEDWRNELYQVTSTRIIDIERRPFYLREERREARLDAIQNISLEIPGFLGKVLNYGSVKIETAGTEAFTFDFVKDPRGVQSEISRRSDAYERRKRQEDAERRRAELLDWFSMYDQVRRSVRPAGQSPSSRRRREA